jgi:hypothetical protein
MSYQSNLSTVLEQIASALDLDETRYKNADEKYRAVASWLENETGILAKYTPAIYAQGSFALGTVVRPLSHDEYDLDFVCELVGFTGDPKTIKEVLRERLMENGHYQPPTLVEMKRCWRLNYQGDFHMDILPAKPSDLPSQTGSAIKIPDKELQQWFVSDPRGYAAWFSSQMETQFYHRYQVMESLAEKQISDVPKYFIKTTLQQVVQLIKRNRDIVFQDDSDDKPVSMIITTLAGLAYGELDLDWKGLFDTLLALLQEMPKFIKEKNGVYYVINPVNEKENFADKWKTKPARRQKFFKWLDSLTADVEALQACGSITEAQAIMEKLFGEKPTQRIIKELAEKQQNSAPVLIGRTPTSVKGNKPWSN